VVINRRIRIRIRHHMHRVMAASDMGEDSPISLAFRVNSQTFLVVLGSEKETALEIHLPNLAPMLRRTHLLSHHTAAGRIDLFHRSHFQKNLRPTRHPTHRATPSHLEEATNLLTINLHGSSGIVVEPEDAVTLGVVLGMTGLRSHNHKTREWTRRMIDNLDTLDTLKVATRELRNSLTLSKGTGSELVRR